MSLARVIGPHTAGGATIMYRVNRRCHSRTPPDDGAARVADAKKKLEVPLHTRLGKAGRESSGAIPGDLSHPPATIGLTSRPAPAQPAPARPHEKLRLVRCKLAAAR